MSDFIFGPEHIGQDVIRLPQRRRGTVKEVYLSPSKTYRLGIAFFHEDSDGTRHYWPMIYFTIDGRSRPTHNNVEIFLELSNPQT